MNGTMFFDTLGSQQESVYSLAKNDKGDLHIINNISKIELNKELLRLPLNLFPTAYPELGHEIDQNENIESNRGLYRPISPKDYSNDENYTPYGYRNSQSPDQDSHGIKNYTRNGYTHLNNQTVVFGKFTHIFPDMSNNSNNFQQPVINNMHYSMNDNNYRNNNNNTYGYYTKSRSNHQNNHQNPNNTNNRRRPINNTYYRNGSDIMVRRAHGLTHRFKSRSDIMKIDPNPSQLLTGGPYDQLSQAIWDVFTSKAQKIETYEEKITIWRNMFLYIRKCISHYALYIVGSTMTGFGLNTSDIDMCLLIRPCTEDPRLDSLQQLHHIKNHLLKYGLIIDSELILAKVPILKFREHSAGFEVDLNCNNSVGIYNTHLLYCYARLDWRVRPLVVMVKLWAQANQINDAKNLTVSSYSWTLMVIHYLQCGITPPVLPCLHTLHPERFNSERSRITDVHEDLKSLEDFHSFNTLSLAELLIGFFGYYSTFDFNQYAISVRAGGRVLIDECKNVKAPKNDQNQWKYMCIEEPFDFTNTARSVYDIVAFRHIKNVICKSFEQLATSKILTSVLPVVMEVEQRVLV